MSRITMTSSASAGWPGMPSRADHGALVHRPARGQHVVLAVLGQRDAEAPGVLERPAHQPGVLHAAAVVGEEPHAELGQLGHGRELRAPPGRP